MKKNLVFAVLAALTTIAAGVAFAHPIHDGTCPQAILAAQTDTVITVDLQKNGQVLPLVSQPAIVTSSQELSNVTIASIPDANLFQTAAPMAMAATTVRGVMTLSDFESAAGMSNNAQNTALLANRQTEWERGSNDTASIVSCSANEKKGGLVIAAG